MAFPQSAVRLALRSHELSPDTTSPKENSPMALVVLIAGAALEMELVKCGACKADTTAIS